jgi:hypothetical protein
METRMGVAIDERFYSSEVEDELKKCIYRVSDVYVDDSTGCLVCEDSIQTQKKGDRCNDR